MDENNVSGNDTNNREDPSDNQTKRHNKRIKIQNGSVEEFSSSSNNTEVDTASTSTDSGFPKCFNVRNRNYRNSRREESSANESAEEEEDSLHSFQEQDNTESNISLDAVSASPDSTSTLIRETDTESDEEFPVLKKPKPRHNWFIVPEVLNRQLGYSSKLYSAELFQKKCYGSLHNVQRLELMYKLEEHVGCVNSLNFYPDGSLLASGSDDVNIVVWDWKVGKCLLKYNTKHRSNVFQSKFLHLCGDLHIASCSRDGQVRIARLSTEGGVVRDNRKLGCHKAPCHKLAVLPDQPHIILSAGEDGVVLSHDVRKAKPESIVNVKVDDREIPLYSIHGHPLKTHEFCVGGKDDTVRVYDQRKTVASLFTYHPFKRSETSYYMDLHVTSALYNHNGSEILASYNDADIYLFDVNAPPGEFIHKYEGHRNGATIKGVSFFGPKSEFVVSGSDCGNVFYWEKNTEAIVQCMLGDDSGVVNCLEPHPQLPFICTSGLDWDVKVWVPSCEEEPLLNNLGETIKNNKKSRRNGFGLTSEISEAPVLWMLWQHLRNTSLRRSMNTGSVNLLAEATSSDSDGDVEDEIDEDEDVDDDEDDDNQIDFASECTTS